MHHQGKTKGTMLSVAVGNKLLLVERGEERERPLGIKVDDVRDGQWKVDSAHVKRPPKGVGWGESHA